MSQANAPREFKFVGGPSRKRRRRNFPKAAAASPKQTRVPTSRAADGEQGAPEGINPACTSPLPTQTLSHVLDEHIGDETVNRLGPQSPSTDAAVSGDLFDWLDASSMNPFFDIGVPFANSFDQTSGQSQTQPQLPFYFGPDIPFGQLWDSPPTDGSSHDFTAAAPPVVEDNDSTRDSPRENATAAEAGDIMQPSLSLPHAPGNISNTISHLLTRCAWSAQRPLYRYLFLEILIITSQIDDREFCVMPLTHDFEANPFRFNAETGRGSQLLLHCILALSYKHILRDTGACSNEAKIHKKKALQMLREMDSGSPESDPQSFCFEANFLDAVLILMTLDVSSLAEHPVAWCALYTNALLSPPTPTPLSVLFLLLFYNRCCCYWG